MFNPLRLIVSSLLTLCILGSVAGQSEKPFENRPEAPIVTASQSKGRVRFTAPATVVRMHLQIYSEYGQVIFDVSSRGNVLDWTLQDSAGEPLGNGSYLCLVTVKSLSGRLSQKTGAITVQDNLISVMKAGELSPAQQQAVGPLEDHTALAILQRQEAPAVTTIANNGIDGQIIRDRGALSFRLGEFFSGKDKEQMRLTEEGNLGIGVDQPQAKLEVAGDVRASGTIQATRGIEFSDGTVQTTGLNGRKNANGKIVSNAVGTGTQNQIAKWVDDSGTLGDSGITETSAGLVGIGTTNPETLLQVGPNLGYGSTTGVLIANDLTGSQYARALQIAPHQTVSPSVDSTLIYALPTVDPGVTVPSQYGLFVDGRQGLGTINSYAAIATGKTGTLGASHNTHLLLGNLAIPADNYAIYDNTGYKSFFKGSVGIGTTSPGYPLTVVRNQNGATGTAAFNTTDGTSAQAFGGVSRTTDFSSKYLTFGVTAPSYAGAGYGETAYFHSSGVPFKFGTNSAHDLHFFTNGITNPRMTIGATGNIGMGTTNPIFNDDGVTGANVGKWVAIDGGNAGGSAYLGLGGTIPNVNDRVGVLNFYNLAMGGVDNRTATIASYNSGALGKGSLEFSTAPSNVGPVTRMTIGSDGGVGINHNASANIGLQIKGATSDSSSYGILVGDATDTPYFFVRSDGKVYVDTTDPNSIPPSKSSSSFFVGQAGEFSVNASGDALQRSIQLTSAAKPTCDLSNRGTFWYVGGEAGVKDTVEVCGKDAGDVFAWRTLY